MAIEYTKAVIYCRVSSEKQVKEGSGLDSQEHRCRDYAESLGLEVENVFRDEGISGGLFDRPAMQTLLKYLDSHWETKYIVIFDDLKRFARDVEVHIRLKSEMRSREAKLKCPNYNFDESAEGEFVETIFAAQNELERKQNRRQVCQKMKARMERGYWCFYPATGYEYQKDKDHGKLIVPIPSITKVIAEGLVAFAEDRLLTQADLIQFLNSKNYQALIGRPKGKLKHEGVYRLLTQPLYAGIIEYPLWGITRRKAHHKGIISEAIYDKIQEKVKRPEISTRVTDRFEFPLRRVISCALCGRKMTGSANYGKNPNKHYPHYTCNNKECCANPKNITASKVQDDYLDLLRRIAVEKEVLDMGKEIAMRLWNHKVDELKSGKAAEEAEIKALERQINEFIEIIPMTKSDSVRARYEAKVEQLDQRVMAIKKVLANKKEPDFEEALSLTLRLLGTPAETWENVGLELKTMVHNMIFTENPKYTLQTGFGTPSLSLPYTIKDHVTTENERLVEVARVALASIVGHCGVLHA